MSEGARGQWASAVSFAVLFGLTWPASQEALKLFPPMFLGGARCVVIGVLFLLISVLRHQRIRQPGVLCLTTALGLFNVAGLAIGMAYSVRDLSSGLASLLVYMQPVLFTAAATRILGERVTRGQALAIACGVAGLVLVLVPDGQTRASWTGIIIALATATSWAVGALLQASTRKWLVQGSAPAWTGMTSDTARSVITATLGPQFLFGGALALAISPAVDHWPRTSGATAPAFWAMVLVASSAGGWFLYVLLIERGVPVRRIAAASFLVPVVANIIAIALLGQRMGLLLALGGTIIIISVLAIGLVAPTVRLPPNFGTTPQNDQEKLSTRASAELVPGCPVPRPISNYAIGAEGAQD